jgi:hypothetical protein
VAHAHVMAEPGLRELDFRGWNAFSSPAVSFFEGLTRQAPVAAVASAMRAAPAAIAGVGAALRQRISDIRSATQNTGELTALVVGGDCAQQRFCETFLRTLGLSVDVIASASVRPMR